MAQRAANGQFTSRPTKPKEGKDPETRSYNARKAEEHSRAAAFHAGRAAEYSSKAK